MTVLTFDTQPVVRGGRYVRRAAFVRRSGLPISAACLIANSMRESLAAVFAVDVSLRLLEPHVPDAPAWTAIESEALIFAVAGTPCEAAFVLRPADALALASGIFGEYISDTRKLSELERGVLERAVDALLHTLAPVCGSRAARLGRQTNGLGSYASYFEVLLEKPVVARIGVAISRDPDSRKGLCVRPSDIAEARLPLRVELGSCLLDPSTFLTLRPGFRIRLQTRPGDVASLKLNGQTVAHGDAGAYRGLAALLVRDGLGSEIA